MAGRGAAGGRRDGRRVAGLPATIAEERSRVLEELGLEPGAYLLVTAHRAGNVDRPERLEALVELLEALPGRWCSRCTRARARAWRRTACCERLSAASILAPALGYLDFLELARHARAVLTDSGGVQKEAYLLGVPCVTLRDTTEWVETVEAGWNVLVDLDRARRWPRWRARRPIERPELYGGGHAAERVAEWCRPTLSAYEDRGRRAGLRRPPAGRGVLRGGSRGHRRGRRPARGRGA